jgi:hypothetical protein
VYLAFYIIRNWFALSFACLLDRSSVHAFALFSSIQRHAAVAMVAAVMITTTSNEYINRRRKREGREIIACVVNSKVVKLIS